MDGNPISPFLKEERQPSQGRYWFKCPGCEHHHCITIQGYGGVGSTGWQLISKSPLVIQPSVRVSTPAHEKEDGTKVPERTLCHLYIGGVGGKKPGFIEYLNDCAHPLAGMTVPMEIPTINTDPPEM